MTQAQALKKIRSMKRDVMKAIDAESIRLIRSGRIDLASYANDYEAPKVVLVVALENLALEYAPPYQGRTHRDIKNLRHI